MSNFYTVFCLLVILGSIPGLATSGTKTEETKSRETQQLLWRFSRNVDNKFSSGQYTDIAREAHEENNKHLPCSACHASKEASPAQSTSTPGKYAWAGCDISHRRHHKHPIKHFVRHHFHQFFRFLDTHLLNENPVHNHLSRALLLNICHARQSFNALYTEHLQQELNMPQASEYYVQAIQPGEFLLLQQKLRPAKHNHNVTPPIPAGIKSAASQSLRQPPAILKIAQQAAAQYR